MMTRYYIDSKGYEEHFSLTPAPLHNLFMSKLSLFKSLVGEEHINIYCRYQSGREGPWIVRGSTKEELAKQVIVFRKLANEAKEELENEQNGIGDKKEV
jgi:hypothetical protein